MGFLLLICLKSITGIAIKNNGHRIGPGPARCDKVSPGPNCVVLPRSESLQDRILGSGPSYIKATKGVLTDTDLAML